MVNSSFTKEGDITVALVWFGLVWFYDLPTFVGHLIFNSYLHVQYIYDLWTHFVDTRSSISDNSIQYKLTKLNGSKYSYVSLTIQLNIIRLHTVKWPNSSIFNNSI